LCEEPRLDAHSAHEQNQDEREGGQQAHDGRHRRVDPSEPQLSPVEGLVLPCEAVALQPLHPVGAHDEHTRGVLLDGGGEVSKLRLGGQIRLVHPPSEQAADPDEERVRQHDEERQHGIDREHDPQRTEVEHRRLDDVQKPHPEKEPHALDIVDSA
jgi:hypothetical protein